MKNKNHHCELKNKQINLSETTLTFYTAKGVDIARNLGFNISLEAS